MSDFPSSPQPAAAPIVIATNSLESVGGALIALNLVVPASTAAWPALVANTILYVPLRISQPMTALRMFWHNGAVGTTVDIGIYTAGGARLVNMGATAQSGLNTAQSVDIADTLLLPGNYYMAFVGNNATGKFAGITNPVGVRCTNALGILEQASATLPATATFAAHSTANPIPIIGLTAITVV